MAGPPPAQLLVGRTLDGQYEVRETIATGGMACIYLARSVAAAARVRVARREVAAICE